MKKNSISISLIILICIVCVSATVSKLKQVLIVGDSISIGYTPFVKDSLGSDVYVEHNRGNGGSTIRGKDSISSWLGNREWDVIVFNFGLHDMVRKDSLNKYDVNGKITLTPQQYKANLNLIVSKLKETTATLIFVTTTVVPEKASGRKTEDPAIYNKVALEVMKENGIAVVDLYSYSLKIHSENAQSVGNVHYTPNGYRLLSIPIVTAIKKFLK